MPVHYVTDGLHVSESSLKCYQSLSYLKISQYFMEAEGSFVSISHHLTCNTTSHKTYHLYKFKSVFKVFKCTTCFGQPGHHQVLKICLIRKSLLSLVADAYAVPLMHVCVVVGVLCFSLLCSSNKERP
jgi:hypothetical protein